ncbi:phosphatidylserine decarboxylase [Chytriomyces confervae]|uniref:Phosphatidylserine decarboxylase proenzyme 1, mitochondrial n=1 Tax=Chytriomyces confervae TaxID=246404 RepID=A0A507F2M4_9FUNG|nr:phosphatidylserine decarboxylase 1 [Chytriomyces hyalinus]TPX69857.1 phosphatidylserine decarboxylase [Chytriomyces confervae]
MILPLARTSLRFSVTARRNVFGRNAVRKAHSNPNGGSSNGNQQKGAMRPVPTILVGLVGLGILKAYHTRSNVVQIYEESGRPSDPDLAVEGSWQRVYAALPLREASRAWGYLNSLTVPVFMRNFLYGTYSKAFGCKLDEMDAAHLTDFENLGTFFYRTLKEGARVVDTSADLVSPSDGKILCLGRVSETRQVPSVKGLTYSLDALLGKSSNCAVSDVSDEVATSFNADAHKSVKKGNALHFCVIYLAPGDYHRYHSPADWSVDTRRHFAGEMLSVSPWIVSKLRNLFILNERVSLTGQWKHGYFSMIPVAATNVGGIIINFDDQFVSNSPSIPSATQPLGTFSERHFTGKDKVVLKRGDEVGGFKLGSTIVLVFEAPEQFEFAYKDGDVVRMGTRDLNKLIMNYLVIEGYKDAVEKFAEESGLSPNVDLDSIEERMKIRAAIQEGRIDEAIERVNDLDPEILDTNPRLYFHLQQQKLIELIRAGNVLEALDFAQEELAARGEENPEFLEELEQTMSLLAFDPSQPSPVAALLDYSQRLKTAGELNAAILKSQCQERNPKLPALLKMLVWSQNQLEEKVTFPKIRNLVTASLEDS